MNLLGIVLSFLYVGLVIGLSMWLQKKQVSEVVTRKVVHILLGNWIFFYPLFTNVWALMFAPFVFVIINYLSSRYQWLESIETDAGSLGTTYYAISLLVLSGAAFQLDRPLLAYIGILVMAYADGFAAIVGSRFGKKHPFPYAPNKTLAGSLTVFVATMIVVVACLSIANPLDRSIWHILWIGLLTGAVGVFVESLGEGGCDNLTLPIISSMLAVAAYEINTVWFYVYFASIILILAFAYWRKSITLDGIVAAIGVAITLYYLGSPLLAWVLVIFFAVGSVATKIKNSHKQAAEKNTESKPRTYIQVLCNALPAAVVVWCIQLFDLSNTYYLAAYAVFAAATADTLASELGLLSSGKVVNPLTLKPVPAGLSGGVSTLGLVASVVGALFIGLFTYRYHNGAGVILVAAMGLLGSLIDSVLGVLLQVKYEGRNRKWQDTPEYKGQEPVAGLAWVSNNAVNLMTLCLVALITWLII